MSRLLVYIKKCIWYYIIAGVALLAGIVLDMFNPRLTKLIIDEVITGGKIELFRGALIGLLLIAVSRGILGYLKEFLFDMGGSKVGVDIREDLFDHIQGMPFSFFDKTNTGELMSRIKEDVDNIWMMLAFAIMNLVENGIYFVLASIMLFTLSWKLALICMITMPLIAFLAIRMEKLIRACYGRISDQGVILNTTAQENIAGVRLVKAFGREKYEIGKFLEQNKENLKLNMERATIFSKFHPKMEFLSNISVVLVVTVGGYFAIGGELTIGSLVAFSAYVYMMIWPMRMVGWITNFIAQCVASLKKIDRIFEEQPTIKNNDNAIVPENVKGHVEFRNVSLEFGGVSVLKNINIDVMPGKTIAIMGVTGSGKSSIVSLIGRYYDCTKGNIYLDGNEIKKIDLRSLREQITVVMQDTFLFSDTIEDNIKFGAPDAFNEEIHEAAKDAKIHDFVMKMPEEYRTVIGERGIGLSGGQKQRIAIARALLRDSKILILDDATSALDMETEYEIQKALERRSDITKFIIAYRISAVKNADEIIIIENGEIVERGTHQQLLKLEGRYYETYCEQFKGLLDIPEEEEA